LRAAGLDLGSVGQKVFDAADRVQFFADDLHVRAQVFDLAARLAQHGLAKTVVLPDQVSGLDLFVVLEHLHERGHAHVGVGVKAEMPEAALVVGQHRIDRRVVQEQHALAGLALVVLVDRVDQHQRLRRRIALQDHLRAVVDGRTQRRQRFFVLAFAVVAQQLQRALALGGFHAAARVDPLDGPDDVSHHAITDCP